MPGKPSLSLSPSPSPCLFRSPFTVHALDPSVILSEAASPSRRLSAPYAHRRGSGSDPDKTSNPGLNIHSFGPPWFLALLGNLGVAYREAWSLSVTGESFDFGDELTQACLGSCKKAQAAFREKYR
ncbi:MAG TPA: hypothetical protein PLP89_09785 [Synergistales bacterium]|nr:hypothetical protein [Synergistales bacterium]HRV71303.1 hypothetical protein [Thermovirgaceae bacterium]